MTVGAFIHPYLDPSVITRLAQGLRAEGYTFIDLRDEQNTVQLEDMLIATRSVEGQLRLQQQYLHEFFVDEQGHIRRERCSSRKITGTVKRTLTIPAGWIYVCRGEKTHPAIHGSICQ